MRFKDGGKLLDRFKALENSSTGLRQKRPSAEQIFSIRIGKAILPAYSTVTPETDETVTPLEPRPANSAKDVTQPLTAWSRKKRAKSRRKDWNPARAWLYCELVQERR
jgi:hypothetical protein